MRKRVDISNFTILGIFLAMVIVTTNINWYGDSLDGYLKADARGYYAHLPAAFIYHDFNYDFFRQIDEKEYYNPDRIYNYRVEINGKKINRYFCGTAIAQLPFFLIAHGIAHASDYPEDGYSTPYMACISLGAIFYLILGLIFINRIMMRFKINARVRSLTLIFGVFGTNLFYYTVGEGGLSHIVSFALIAAFFYYLMQYFERGKPSTLLLLGALFGFIFVVRPVNILVILALPLATSGRFEFRAAFSQVVKHSAYLIPALFLAFIFVAPQLIEYKLAIGQLWADTYDGEGFNWSDPHIFDFLFSYKKGLFVYTPLYLISLSGLYFIFKKSILQGIFWALFFSILVYVFSSWWMWYYGGSFSTRPFVEFLPFFILLLGIAIQGFPRGKIKVAFVSVCFVLMVFCQFQTLQYRYGIIHWADMDKAKYWQVFLSLDQNK